MIRTRIALATALATLTLGTLALLPSTAAMASTDSPAPLAPTTAAAQEPTTAPRPGTAVPSDLSWG